MYFRDIVGHQSTKTQLMRNVREGRVSHALLFAGEDGIGALPLAIAFAGYILCENPQLEDRCGICHACKKMDILGHPDVHFAYPLIKSKAQETDRRAFIPFLKTEPYMTLKEWEDHISGENKKSVITTGESEAIVKALSLKSFSGGHKIFIVWHAAKMNREASNRFLKTLEEPTQKTILILVENSADMLISTIVSRLQIWNLKPLEEKDICQQLIKEFTVSESVAKNATHLASANFQRARNILRTTQGDPPYLKMFSAWMRACVKSNLMDALTVCDALNRLSKDQQQHFLEFCLQFLHQSVLFEYVSREESRFSEEAHTFADRFAPYMAKSNLEAFHDVFSHAHYMLQRNASVHLLLMKMSCDMMKIFKEHKGAVSNA